MRLSGVLTGILVLGLAQSAVAGEPQKNAGSDTGPSAAKASPALQRVAVLDMVATGEQQETAKMLTEVLSVEASRVKGLEVIGMGDIAALIGFEQQKQLVGCTDDACLAEIGGALGVRAILSSKIGKVGDTYVLSMRLVDTQAAKLLGSVYKTVPGKPDALISAVQQATPELLNPLAGENAPAQTGAVAADNSGKEKAPRTVSYKVAASSSGWPVWPGYALGGTGATLLLGSAVLGVLAFATYPAADAAVDVGNTGFRLVSPDMQEQYFLADTYSFGSLSALCLGGILLTSGLSYGFLLAGDADE